MKRPPIQSKRNELENHWIESPGGAVRRSHESVPLAKFDGETASNFRKCLSKARGRGEGSSRFSLEFACETGNWAVRLL